MRLELVTVSQFTVHTTSYQVRNLKKNYSGLQSSTTINSLLKSNVQNVMQLFENHISPNAHFHKIADDTSNCLPSVCPDQQFYRLSSQTTVTVCQHVRHPSRQHPQQLAHVSQLQHAMGWTQTVTPRYDNQGIDQPEIHLQLVESSRHQPASTKHIKEKPKGNVQFQQTCDA